MSHLRRALYVVGPERAARLTGHEHLHLKRLLWSWHSSVEIEFRVSVDLSVELLNSAQQDGSAAADSPSPTGARYLIVFVEEGAIAALDSEAHARVTPAALSTGRLVVLVGGGGGGGNRGGGGGAAQPSPAAKRKRTFAELVQGGDAVDWETLSGAGTASAITGLTCARAPLSFETFVSLCVAQLPWKVARPHAHTPEDFHPQRVLENIWSVHDTGYARADAACGGAAASSATPPSSSLLPAPTLLSALDPRHLEPLVLTQHREPLSVAYANAPFWAALGWADADARASACARRRRAAMARRAQRARPPRATTRPRTPRS